MGEKLKIRKMKKNKSEREIARNLRSLLRERDWSSRRRDNRKFAEDSGSFFWFYRDIFKGCYGGFFFFFFWGFLSFNKSSLFSFSSNFWISFFILSFCFWRYIARTVCEWSHLGVNTWTRIFERVMSVSYDVVYMSLEI